MTEILKVLLFAAMPALGNFAGGALVEFVDVSRRTLSLALHAAAGVVLALVGIELMPDALASKAPWVPIAAFVGGGLFFILMDAGIDLVQGLFTESAEGSGAWVIFAGVVIDLFSDGVMIGTGSTMSVRLGLLLALSQVPADMPSNFAAIALFRKQGFRRSWRLLLAAGSSLPVLLGALVGYWVARDLATVYRLILLAFTAGLLFAVVVEEIVPQAHRQRDARLATIFLVSGFALFASISAYLE